MTTIKDKEGNRLVNEDEVLERWREHFWGVLVKYQQRSTFLNNGKRPGGAEMLKCFDTNSTYFSTPTGKNNVYQRTERSHSYGKCRRKEIPLC